MLIAITPSLGTLAWESYPFQSGGIVEGVMVNGVMVNQQHSIETPENVQITYESAGLGKRFVALVTDYLLMILIGFVVFILYLLFSFLIADFVSGYLDRFNFEEALYESQAYFTGMLYLAAGFGSFFYFFVCELYMKGQTPGKKSLKIRVIKSNGFALDGMSILIRNLFRVVDNPFTGLWLVALFTKGNRRVGDLVGGTMVVDEEDHAISEIREKLSEQSRVESEYSFDYARLDKLDAQDFQKLEILLERLGNSPVFKRQSILKTVVKSLSGKMEIPGPDPGREQKFLEDLLAAEYRRQNRKLG